MKSTCFFRNMHFFMIEHQDKQLQVSFIQVDVKHCEKHMFFCNMHFLHGLRDKNCGPQL